MQTIATFTDTIAANLAKAELEDAGIESYLADEQTVGVAWHLSVAVGGIKLQVNEENAEQARLILDEPHDHDEVSLEPGVDAKPPDDDETFTLREELADRALRGALLGIFLPPLEIYVFWLLIKIFISDERIEPRYRTRAIIAAVVNIPVMLLLGRIVMAFVPKF